MKKKEKGYYFVLDFDGPLFNGREAAKNAIENTYEHFEKTYGKPNLEFLNFPLIDPISLIRILYSRLNLKTAQISRIATYYISELNKYESRTQINSNIKEKLIRMYMQGYKFALFSSRPKKDLTEILLNNGIKKVFSVIISGDDVLNPKPMPDGLQKIADHFEIQTDDLIVIGDSLSDYLAAKKAHSSYYHAAWTGEPNNLAYCRADLVLNDIEELIEVLDSGTFSTIYQEPSVDDNLKKAIEKRDLSFYGGAGVSIQSGYSNWDNEYIIILKKLKSKLLLNKLSYTEALQVLASNFDNSKKIFDAFLECFDKPDLKPNSYHNAMLRSEANIIWTSNYDQLFEKANTIAGFGRKIVRNDPMLLENFRHGKLVIKMNGDFVNATFNRELAWGVVVLQEQFDLADKRREEIWRLFEDNYRNRCIVFVGLSFTDPELHRILSVARQKLSRTKYNHYFLKKIPSNPIKRKRYLLHADNLKRYHINTLFFENYPKINEFVEKLSSLSMKPVVGFSGNFLKITSTDGTYNKNETLNLGKLNASKVEKFCAYIGKELASRGYRITSGGAPVVGIPAVNSAFNINPSLARFYLRKQINKGFMRSAPVIIVSSNTYEAMRKRFIGEVSLLLAIGGMNTNRNKPGILSEIEMALTKQVPVVLFPQAGGFVDSNWNNFINNLEDYYNDPLLIKKIREINNQIASISIKNFFNFVISSLPDLLEDLIFSYVGSCSKHSETEQW